VAVAALLAAYRWPRPSPACKSPSLPASYSRRHCGTTTRFCSCSRRLAGVRGRTWAALIRRWAGLRCLRPATLPAGPLSRASRSPSSASWGCSWSRRTRRGVRRRVPRRRPGAGWLPPPEGRLAVSAAGGRSRGNHPGGPIRSWCYARFVTVRSPTTANPAVCRPRSPTPQPRGFAAPTGPTADERPTSVRLVAVRRAFDSIAPRPGTSWQAARPGPRPSRAIASRRRGGTHTERPPRHDARRG